VSESAKFSGLSCELVAPFSWVVTDSLDSEELTLIERDNYSRLQIIQGLEESPETLDDMPGLAQEIHRLDFKMNVLLELVALVATKDSPSPKPLSLVLSCEAIQWVTLQSPPEVGEHVKMDLFVERRFPFPLILMGVVESVSSEASQSKVIAKLLPHDESLQELWDKFIFRCHRRHIARMKRDGNH